eukprot:PLAT10487.1.p1 GENE.PLAT10487.1~~PLAT10487.1.p1  ORF type:complete len:311 (+),score=132.96 PLAT10487.1:1-933(+)
MTCWTRGSKRLFVDGTLPDDVLDALPSQLAHSAAPLAPSLDKLRVIKSAAELDLLAAAADATAAGMRSVSAALTAGASVAGQPQPTRTAVADLSSESDVAAAFQYAATVAGGDELSFPTIAACGAAATVLHYQSNNAPLRTGQLLLMDCGVKRGGYVADVTRVWPVGGVWSQPQLDVYSAVLDVQQAMLAMLASADVTELTLDDLTQAAADKMAAHLPQLRLPAHAVRKYFPHGLGHFLGMDVHDTPAVRSQSLAEGMVITVEPGLYIPADDLDAPAELRGIGVRIEDDVVLRKGGGITVLTDGVAKQPW